MLGLHGIDLALGLATGELPGWFGYVVPALGLALLGVAGGCAYGLAAALAGLRRLEQRLERLEALDGIEASVKHLSSGKSDLDLRRIEHALLEIRADQRRLHDTMLQVFERGGSRAEPGAPAGLAERAVNRLVAMGYERVQVLSPAAELAEMGADGEILVEARRHGALHKGRVLVRQGAVDEVVMQGPYAFFP